MAGKPSSRASTLVAQYEVAVSPVVGPVPWLPSTRCRASSVVGPVPWLPSTSCRHYWVSPVVGAVPWLPSTRWRVSPVVGPVPWMPGTRCRANPVSRLSKFLVPSTNFRVTVFGTNWLLRSSYTPRSPACRDKRRAYVGRHKLTPPADPSLLLLPPPFHSLSQIPPPSPPPPSHSNPPAPFAPPQHPTLRHREHRDHPGTDMLRHTPWANSTAN